MQIKIEAGVPLPARRGAKYPFREMKPGDSFEVVLGNGSGFTDPLKLQNCLNSCARAALGKGGVTTRMNADRTAVRVWRLK